MGNDDGGASTHERIHRRLHMSLRLGVERRRCFVENQDGRVLQNRTRDRNTLPLAAGQANAVLADEGLETLRQGLNEIQCMRSDGGALDGIARRIGHCAVGDVRGDGVVEKRHVLAHQRNVAAQVGERELVDASAVEHDSPRCRLVEAGNQVDQRCLATAGRAHQPDALAGSNHQADLAQRVLVRAVVAKRHAVESELAAHPFEDDGATVLFRLFVDESENALRRGEAALDVGIDSRQRPHTVEKSQQCYHVSREPRCVEAAGLALPERDIDDEPDHAGADELQ